MGKATQTLEQLLEKPLTAAELKARRAAVEDGGDVEAKPDGRLVKIVLGSPQPERQAGRAQPATWD